MRTRAAVRLQFADQLTDNNQILATVNYVTSSTLRYYNFNNYNVGGAPLNDYTGSGGQMVSNLTNGTQCFAAYDGYLASDVDQVNPIAAGSTAPCNDPLTQGSFSDPTGNSDYGDKENQKLYRRLGRRHSGRRLRCRCFVAHDVSGQSSARSIRSRRSFSTSP